MDDKTLTDYPDDKGGSSMGSPDTQRRRPPAPASPAATQDFSGSTLGNYRLVRKIAEGGMGVVYEAIQLNLDRRVALKILNAQLASRPEFLQRFHREARATAALNHPHLVQVHDFTETDGVALPDHGVCGGAGSFRLRS